MALSNVHDKSKQALLNQVVHVIIANQDKPVLCSWKDVLTKSSMRGKIRILVVEEDIKRTRKSPGLPNGFQTTDNQCTNYGPLVS